MKHHLCPSGLFTDRTAEEGHDSVNPNPKIFDPAPLAIEAAFNAPLPPVEGEGKGEGGALRIPHHRHRSLSGGEG